MTPDEATSVLRSHFEAHSDGTEDFDLWLEQSLDHVEVEYLEEVAERGATLDEVDAAFLLLATEPEA